MTAAKEPRAGAAYISQPSVRKMFEARWTGEYSTDHVRRRRHRCGGVARGASEAVPAVVRAALDIPGHAVAGVDCGAVRASDRHHQFGYRFMVLEQLAEIGIEADVLLEPMRRDSGPRSRRSGVRASSATAMPWFWRSADHVVRDNAAFVLPAASLVAADAAAS